MTEWGVVGVIIALGGFISLVVTPIIKLNTTVVNLTTVVNGLIEELRGVKKDSDTMYDKLHEEELRITKLESFHRGEV